MDVFLADLLTDLDSLHQTTLPHLPVSPTCVETVLAKALQILCSPVQFCCHMLPLLLQPLGIPVHPLQQMSQSQGEHLQLGHRDLTCLL